MATDQYGRIIRRGRPDLPDTRNRPTYRSSSLSWWSRLNNFVINIGNWFADNAEDFTERLVGILGILAIIGLGIWVIGVFAGQGILMGILSIFGACLIGYGIFIAIGIFGWILGILLLALRYIFWNIYSLLIALTIVGFLCFGISGS